MLVCEGFIAFMNNLFYLCFSSFDSFIPPKDNTTIRAEVNILNQEHMHEYQYKHNYDFLCFSMNPSPLHYHLNVLQ